MCSTYLPTSINGVSRNLSCLLTWIDGPVISKIYYNFRYNKTKYSNHSLASKNGTTQIILSYDISFGGYEIIWEILRRSV